MCLLPCIRDGCVGPIESWDLSVADFVLTSAAPERTRSNRFVENIAVSRLLGRHTYDRRSFSRRSPRCSACSSDDASHAIAIAGSALPWTTNTALTMAAVSKGVSERGAVVGSALGGAAIRRLVHPVWTGSDLLATSRSPGDSGINRCQR